LLTVFAPKKGYTKRSLYAKILCARNQERVFTPGVKTGGEGLELEQDKKDRCIRVEHPAAISHCGSKAETLIRFAKDGSAIRREMVTNEVIVRQLFRNRCCLPVCVRLPERVRSQTGVEFRSSPSGKIIHPMMDKGVRRFQM